MFERPTKPSDHSYGTVPLNVSITEDTLTIVDANDLEVAHWQRDVIAADPDVAFAVATAVDCGHTDPVGLLEQQQSH